MNFIISYKACFMQFVFMSMCVLSSLLLLITVAEETNLKVSCGLCENVNVLINLLNKISLY